MFQRSMGRDCFASKHGLCRSFTWKRKRKIGEPRATSRGRMAEEASILRGPVARPRKKSKPGAPARKEGSRPACGAGHVREREKKASRAAGLGLSCASSWLAAAGLLAWASS